MREDTPDYHRTVHRRHFSDFGLWDGLISSERELLSQHGAWLKALAEAKLKPITLEQIRFVKVCEGLAEAKSSFELVWVKYEANRRIFCLSERQRLVELALKDDLNAHQLEQIIKNAERFDFIDEEINIFLSKLAKLRAPKAQNAAWTTCIQCNGDGGAGGRCPRCGGNGFEP